MAIAASTLLGLNNVYNGYVDYRELSRDTNLANEMEEHVIAMELHIADFLVSHEQLDLDQYNGYKNHLLHDIDLARDQIQNPARVELLENIITFTDEYTNAAEQLKHLVLDIDKIVASYLDPTGSGAFLCLCKHRGQAMKMNGFRAPLPKSICDQDR